MTSSLFVVALIVLIATAAVLATDLTVGSTVMGDAFGSASATRFGESQDLVRVGDFLLVADAGNRRIANVSLADGTSREFPVTGIDNGPYSIALCDDGVGYLGNGYGVLKFDTSAGTPAAASYWIFASGVYGLACAAGNLLFVTERELGIRAYDRSNSANIVWEATCTLLGLDGGSSGVYNLALSPDGLHLAFSAKGDNKVGTINIATKAFQFYGSGIAGSVGGTAGNARFNGPFGCDWSKDGRTILVNDLLGGASAGFAGVRFIDFETGSVSNSANTLMPSTYGWAAKVLDTAGTIAVTYMFGLKVLSVAGAASTSCGNVPNVAHSNGGSASAGAFGDTVTYACDGGFTAVSQISTCQSDTATWSSVVCRSDADFIIELLGNSINALSALEEVAQTFGFGVAAPFTSDAALQQGCQAIQ